MAFRYDEVFSGAMIAAFAFALITSAIGIVVLVAAALIGGGSLTAGSFGFLFWYLPMTLVLMVLSLIAAIAELPIAWMLGRALRRERRRRVHLLSFAALGAASTVLWTIALGLAVNAPSHPSDPGPLIGVWALVGAAIAPVGAGATAFGWYRAMRRALADDAARG